ncbi:MAG: hypothetical protein HYW05_02580 [Candidatus Diapherotrites archaeon]|nr:hypothetical protein [Candidatus Diapherotrites archaeon]
MKCPTCSSAKLVLKKVTKDHFDGSECSEFKCPKCHEIFMDIKLFLGYWTAA